MAAITSHIKPNNIQISNRDRERSTVSIMSTSDITLNISKFKPENVSPNTQAVNGYILSQAIKISTEPKWWEASLIHKTSTEYKLINTQIGTEKFRSLQDQGKTSWPAPTFRHPRGKYITIPSREKDRLI